MVVPRGVLYVEPFMFALNHACIREGEAIRFFDEEREDFHI